MTWSIQVIISGMDEQLDRITDLQQASRIASYDSIESVYIFYGVLNPQRWQTSNMQTPEN